MSNGDKIKINFRITGTDLNAESGYDLYYLSQSMSLFHKLIEKTYLTHRNEKHMTKSKRNDLKIKVFNIRDGSFEADLQLLINQVMPSMLTMVTTLDAKGIWEMAKLSFDYLLSILKANREGKSVMLKEIDAENSQIITGDNNVILNVHPDVVLTSRSTYPIYRRLGNLIDDKKQTLEKVVFGQEKEFDKIEIGVEEKVLLQNPNILDEKPVKFKGKIFNADANKCSGKLEVLDSEDIELGEYVFEFIDKENTKMKDFFTVEGNFVALKLTSFNPNTLERVIKRLNIVSVNSNSSSGDN